MGVVSHYAQISLELGPSGLAGALLRRTHRLARKALYRPRAWDAARLAAVVGVSRDEAASRLLEAGPAPAWCDPVRRKSVAAALDRCAGGRAQALRRAKWAAARSFKLFGAQVQFAPGDPIDWCLSKRQYPLVVLPGFAQAPRSVDPKFPWALARLDHLVSLAQGWWVARGEVSRARFVQELIAQTHDFLRANPPGVGLHWTCPMEVSLRAANLAQAVSMLRELPAIRDRSFALRVLAALVEHCEHVEAHLEDDGAVPNNHLVADYVGLMVVASLFPNLPGAARWTRVAARGLREGMEAQVYPDGLSFEGSIPYHRLAVELFTLGLLASRAAAVPLGAAFEERLRRMFGVAAAYCSEQGLAPQLGDNDSGRALPLPGRSSLDHGYLAPLGAALFADADLKRPGDVLPEEVAWLLGLEGARRFERLKPRWKARPFGSLSGGLYVLRGAGATVAVSAGRPGQRGVGGHSHNDRLSFELHLAGEPVIVDPGTGAYPPSWGLRDRLRCTSAHNSVQIDGREQAPLDPARPFALLGPSCELRARHTGPRADRLVARYSANGVEVERTLVLDKKQALLAVSDRLEGRWVHQLSLRLHLPDAAVRLRPPDPGELRHAEAACEAWGTPGPLAAELGPEAAPRAVVLFAAGAAISIEPALYSPGYGEVRAARAILARTRTRLPAAVAFVVLFRAAGPGTERPVAES